MDSAHKPARLSPSDPARSHLEPLGFVDTSALTEIAVNVHKRKERKTMNKSAFIIAVSGPSGSGKSTLTKQLRDKLVDAISFHFDDYASTNKYPDDFVEWLEKGADPKLVQNPNFNRDLYELVQGRSIKLPSNQIVKSEKYIIVRTIR